MYSLNRVTLLGNLTRDIETKAAGEQSVANFSIATNRKWTQNGEKREATDFHDCVAWGKLAEILTQWVKKGDKLYVEGRLQTRSWEGPDGKKNYRTEIVVDNAIMLGGKHATAPTEPADEPEAETADIPF